MRVTVTTVAAFIEELNDAGESGSPLMASTVRWEDLKNYLNKERVSWEVGVRATALVGSKDDDGFYLLEYARDLGVDNSSKAPNEAVAIGERDQVLAMCDKFGWRLRDGRWEI